MMESLRKQIQELEADIKELEEKIRTHSAEKKTLIAQAQAQIFLERIFAPYMDGLCSIWGLSPEDGLRHLIEEEATLDKIAYDNSDDLMEFMSQPELRIMITVARPLEDVSEEWIKDKTDVILEVMERIRPSLARIIITTPGGIEWFYDSLTGLRDILFGKTRRK